MGRRRIVGRNNCFFNNASRDMSAADYVEANVFLFVLPKECTRYGLEIRFNLLCLHLYA